MRNENRNILRCILFLVLVLVLLAIPWQKYPFHSKKSEPTTKNTPHDITVADIQLMAEASGMKDIAEVLDIKPSASKKPTPYNKDNDIEVVEVITTLPTMDPIIAQEMVEQNIGTQNQAPNNSSNTDDIEIAEIAEVVTTLPTMDPIIAKELSAQHVQITPNLDHKITSNNNQNKQKPTSVNEIQITNIYSPQIELGAYYFTNGPHDAWIARAFMPMFTRGATNLWYLDVRGMFFKEGTIWEGNFGMGYRKLNPMKGTMDGVYAFFDRRRVAVNELFSQVTFGAEHWDDRIFVGANFYLPVGVRSYTSYDASINSQAIVSTPFNIVTNNSNLQSQTVALVGGDITLGYQMTEKFTGFIGAFKYNSSTSDVHVSGILGPFLNLRYIFYPRTPLVIGTIDRITMETQLQYDSVRGTRWYAGIRASIAFGKSDLRGFQRHMIDAPMRDIDVSYVTNN